MSGGFPDHFSRQADAYQVYRPGYPAEMFDWLASLTPQHHVAWDCATGSGQSAIQLARHFQTVFATDASQAQLHNAVQLGGVQYLACTAEQVPFADHRIDLITVAQALHWFRLDEFYAEVRRVLKQGGVLAVWTYNLLTITPELDALIHELYADVLGNYWPFERKHIESGYQELAFPFNRVAAPDFAMGMDWTLEHLLGYLSTWSAVQRYMAERGIDPVLSMQPRLQSAWGDVRVRYTQWPLSLLVGRN
ncbi:MAG: class I SAM-dependent methyltransferase [Gammaproteobacteria bacterium]|nr:class I SAM-dependent methyltransferase [Gammaproteobacteria bacterium]MDH5651467.1 class I SAM-dependent methyltransferase [Gammaproteobacteria bacterium]